MKPSSETSNSDRSAADFFLINKGCNQISLSRDSYLFSAGLVCAAATVSEAHAQRLVLRTKAIGGGKSMRV